MIYFIQSPSGSIKIGSSRWPAERLCVLKKKHSRHLKMLAVHDGGRPEEASLHEHFDHLKIQGEWFRPGPELLDYIDRHATIWARKESGRDGWGAISNLGDDKPELHVWADWDAMGDAPFPPWGYHVIWKGHRYDFAGPSDRCHNRTSALVQGRWRAHWLATGRMDLANPSAVQEIAR